MLVHLRRSLTMAVICLVFFGFVYALAGTGVAQLFFAIRPTDPSPPTARRSSVRTGQSPQKSQRKVVPRASGRHRALCGQP